ncbi:MAG: cob(I)yrinic acid a,c-diamide adenosyltransferase [Desulfobulbaceae bacterium]|uniref:corrinoid adenosyltransferase n=1 Tax=Candidatus Desulfobia pelagia TaxID=2841692 RepID=A0A8J6NDZ9_9BACT|nr:cob(I)yrinic acid a,c-diamide adenosyltransferase [Candidatus Desulfobia pelagia]
MAKKGLVLLNTGNGKGKSTAAFGQALRAAGSGFRVCIIQFIKGNSETGEARAFARLADTVEFHVKGSGFTWTKEDKTEAVAMARDAFEFARSKINSDLYDMVVLDEMTYIIRYDMVSEAEVLELISNRPERLHLVITGRDASKGLIGAADLVTEMVEVKHPYQQGVKAQRGVEF